MVDPDKPVPLLPFKVPERFAPSVQPSISDEEEKFELDLWYVNNQSFILDLKILLITIKKVLFQENINKSNSITMEKFKGYR